MEKRAARDSSGRFVEVMFGAETRQGSRVDFVSKSYLHRATGVWLGQHSGR